VDGQASCTAARHPDHLLERRAPVRVEQSITARGKRGSGPGGCAHGDARSENIKDEGIGVANAGRGHRPPTFRHKRQLSKPNSPNHSLNHPHIMHPLQPPDLVTSLAGYHEWIASGQEACGI